MEFNIEEEEVGGAANFFKDGVFADTKNTLLFLAGGWFWEPGMYEPRHVLGPSPVIGPIYISGVPPKSRLSDPHRQDELSDHVDHRNQPSYRTKRFLKIDLHPRGPYVTFQLAGWPTGAKR